MRHAEFCIDLVVTIRTAHCNARGFAHGGFVCAMADMAMGLTSLLLARRKHGDSTTGVTASLSIDFVDAAQVGEIVEFRPTVLKVGGALTFADCRVVAGGRLIARASGSFRMFPSIRHRDDVPQ